MFDPAAFSRDSSRQSAPPPDAPKGGLSADSAAADKPTGEKTRMNVSPLDLRQTRFRSAFRGFDRVEVTTFMAAVADDYEQALRETDKLRQDVARLDAIVKEQREHEQSLKSTLMTAQKLSEDIKS